MFKNSGDLATLKLYDTRNYKSAFATFGVGLKEFTETLQRNSGVSGEKGKEIYESCRLPEGDNLLEFNYDGSQILLKLRGGVVVVIDAFDGKLVNVLTEHITEKSGGISVATFNGKGVSIVDGSEICSYKNVEGGVSARWKEGHEGDVKGVRFFEGVEGGVSASDGVLTFWGGSRILRERMNVEEGGE
ncbi:hypothetical protein TL16_g13069, partial [Triparma laevis f. inornata]